MVKRRDYQSIWLYPHHFDALDKDEDEDTRQTFAALFNVDFAAFTQEDFEKFHQKISAPDCSTAEVMKLLLDWLQDNVPIFTMQKDQSLPPR